MEGPEALEVLTAADEYGLKRLVRLCEVRMQRTLLLLQGLSHARVLIVLASFQQGFLIRCLDKENCASLLGFAEVYSLSMLRTAATSFAIRHYDEVTGSPMWSELGEELRNEVRAHAPAPLSALGAAWLTHAWCRWWRCTRATSTRTWATSARSAVQPAPRRKPLRRPGPPCRRKP